MANHQSEECKHSLTLRECASQYWRIVPFDHRPRKGKVPDLEFAWCNAILRQVETELQANMPAKFRGKESKDDGFERRVGSGWRLGNARVYFSDTVHDWLQQALLMVQIQQAEAVATIQRVYRGHRVRKVIMPVRRVWQQVRQALSHALRAQFAEDYDENSDEDSDKDDDDEELKNVSGIDELNAVQSFVKTMRLLHKKHGGKRAQWAAERITAGASTQQQNILAVIQCKHTLQQVIAPPVGDDEKGPGSHNTGKVNLESMHTAKERLELLSYALQEARRLDKQVLATAYASGLYDFNPLQDDEDDEPYCMQTTNEFTSALKAYQTLKAVSNTLPSKLKRMHLGQCIALDVAKLVKSVDSLDIGPVREVEVARRKLKSMNKLCSSLESAVLSEDIDHIKQLLEKAGKVSLRRHVVERVHARLVTLQLQAALRDAVASHDVGQLTKAIQFTMDVLVEEGSKRKKRKQKKMRTQWILKKKKNALTDEERAELDSFGDEAHLVINVDKDLERAKVALRQLLDPKATVVVQEPAGSSSDKDMDKGVLEQLAQQEQNALNLALDQAASALDAMQDDGSSADEDPGDAELTKLQVRKQSTRLLAKATKTLQQFNEQLDERMRAEDLVMRPSENPKFPKAKYSSADLVRLKARIEMVQEMAEEYGQSGKDMDALTDADIDKFGTKDLQDITTVTELNNCVLEINMHLEDRARCLKQIETMTTQLARCADESRSDADLDKLKDKLKFVLQNARLVCIEESTLEHTQNAYDALRKRDADLLAFVIERSISLTVKRPSVGQSRDNVILSHQAEDDHVTPGGPDEFPAVVDVAVHSPKKRSPVASQHQMGSADATAPSPATKPRSRPRHVSELSMLMEEEKREAADMLFKKLDDLEESQSIYKEDTLRQALEDIESAVNDLAGSESGPNSPSLPSATSVDVVLKQANRTIRLVKDNLAAVASFPDLVSRPGPNTPMRAGRVHASDLEDLRIKMEDAVQKASQSSKHRTHGDMLKKHISFLEELAVGQAQATDNIQRVYAHALTFPFFAAADDESADVDRLVTDERLATLQSMMAEALILARKSGVPEDQLSVFQSMYDDVVLYVAGREEARRANAATMSELEQVVQNYPELFQGRAVLADITALVPSEDPNGPQHAMDSKEDADLVAILKQVQNVVADCDMVALPADDAALATLRDSMDAIASFTSARYQARRLLEELAATPVDKSSRSRIKAALDIAKRCGLTRSGAGPAVSQAHKNIQTLKGNLQVLSAKAKLSRTNSSMAQIEKMSEEDLDALDRKLTRMVPQARKALSKAIKEKNASALDQAVKNARVLELRLQRLRAMRQKLKEQTAGKA